MSLTQLAAHVLLFQLKGMFWVESIENKELFIINDISGVFSHHRRPVSGARPRASDFSVMWRSLQRVVGLAVSTCLAAGAKQMAVVAVTHSCKIPSTLRHGTVIIELMEKSRCPCEVKHLNQRHGRRHVDLVWRPHHRATPNKAIFSSSRKLTPVLPGIGVSPQRTL